MSPVAAPWRRVGARRALVGRLLGPGLASLLAPLALLAAGVQQVAPDGPWQEALVSVSRPAETARFFTEVAGYEVLARPDEHASQMQHWGLADGAGASSILLGKPGTDHGYVRLIRFTGVEQRPIRATARAWDTGGFFSLMVRAKDIDARFSEALALGWSAESDPVRFDFTGLSIRNVVLKGPDGLNIAVYERLAPPLQHWPPFERMTQVFNAMQMVRDKDAAVDFYTRVLGFKVFWQGDYLDPAPTMNNFGLPQNYVTEVPRRTGILYPVPGETGRVEVMQFAGFDGRDLGARAVPPNLGILAVRYPVSDLDARLAAIAAAGWPLAYPASTIELPPYGRVRIAGVRAPDGALISFYQRLGGQPDR